jgi:hypothetical protein
VIDIPADAEVVLIPKKWLPLLQSISRGPFIRINFPLPIVVSAMVPDDEIWFANSNNNEITVIKKETVNDDKVKALVDSSDGHCADRLFSPTS